ncbi:alpha/beta hydrolase [Franzmannia qiaohouensis]|uniref:Alpha/beta hydrolase-fold protein n=1 Tax=Franzmannia qiaohouensis TaxID=1329370 RepID=A0ABU1HIF5_9GAMM|nr:alpha/beta hydrolase-fold protein [Halomonas qiaohouensis]MDR5907076.1 alpha/beta hydrolase-fold protein [Halomonas qiaohouensis]
MTLTLRGLLLAMMTLLFATPALAGQVSHQRFASETLGREYPYTIYLPDGYAVSNQSYPVIYLLHGSFGTDRDWTSSGNLRAVADRLIQQGRIPPAVIVMPGSFSWWVDGHNEAARTAFFEDLMPHIEAAWHVHEHREGRAIGGNSAGGYGSLNFILERPDLFAAAAALSPASYSPMPPGNSSARRHPAFLDDEERFDPVLWSQLNYTAYLDDYLAQSQVVPLYLSAGNRDPLDAEEHARRIYRELVDHQPEHLMLEVLRGGHTWRVWRTSLPSALMFMGDYLDPPRALEE